MHPFSSTARLVLGLFVLFLGVGCDSGGTSEGSVTGVVTNSFSRAIEGATVTLTPTGSTTAACTATTNATGNFSCDVDDGTYAVAVTAPGYSPQTASVTVVGTGTVTVPPLAGLGSINATLINALTGNPIPNSAIECRRLLAAGGTYGGVEFTSTTSAQGLLAINGVFTGEAQCGVGTGTATIPLQITIVTTTTGTVAATPPPALGSWRVVLTWGQNPSDLDSHLTGPIAGGSDRFHVYYSDESYEGHNLDVDDTSGFGPETTTIVPAGVNGVYRFSVHNYSLDDSPATAGQSLFESGATVRLYDSAGLRATYVAPAPTAANGGTNATTWRVFELTINGTQATIAGAAPAGLGYVLSSSSGDASSFLTAAGAGVDLGKGGQ